MKNVGMPLRRGLKWFIYDITNETLRLYEKFQECFETRLIDKTSSLRARILAALFAAQLVSPLLCLSFVSKHFMIQWICTLTALVIEMMLLQIPLRQKLSGWFIGIGLIIFKIISSFLISDGASRFTGLSLVPIVGIIFISGGQFSFLPLVLLLLLEMLYQVNVVTNANGSQAILPALTSELLAISLASCIFYMLTAVESEKENNRLNSKNEQVAQMSIKLNELNLNIENSTIKLKSTAEELKRSNRSLKEALETKRMFFAKISDELRNPINSIVGNLELLEEEKLDPAIQEKISSIKWSADLLLQMTNNLIDFAKLVSGKIEINKTKTSVPQMLERLWALSFYKLKQKELRGFLSLDKNVPKYLLLDEEKLIEVCHNLIANSIKYTNRGQIKVFVTWHPSDEKCHLQHELTLLDSLQRFSETTQATVLTKDHFERLKIEPRDVEDDGGSPMKARLMMGSQSTNQAAAQPKSGSSAINEGYSPYIGINLLKESLLSRKDERLLLDNHQSRFPHLRVDMKRGHHTAMSARGILKIEIIDTGSGIDPNLLSFLGKALFSRDIELAKRIGGKGLGLYLASELTKLMDGEVLYFSKMNFGTSIIVKIPCETVDDLVNAVKIKEGRTATTMHVLKNQTLMEIEPIKIALIVDDEKINRLILESYFKRFNIRCIQAENGKQAVEIFKSNPPGYFLFATVDIQMPVMDGKECCAQIRAFEEEENRECILPIVIVTGNCFEQDKQEIMDPSSSCRANYFYRKPLKMSDCENLVRDILGENFSFKKHQILTRSQTTL